MQKKGDETVIINFDKERLTLTSEQKEEIIAQALSTEGGRISLAEVMALNMKKPKLNIDPSQLHTLWFENEKGDKKYLDLSTDHFLDDVAVFTREGYIYQHSMFPQEVNHKVLKMVTRQAVDACSHPSENIKVTHGWRDGMFGRECHYCFGTQTKQTDDPWPVQWTAGGSREIFNSTSSWSDKLVLAMANSGKYKVSEAILIAAQACERCLNVLLYQYCGDAGYAEESEQWQACRTQCLFCEGLYDN